MNALDMLTRSQFRYPTCTSASPFQYVGKLIIFLLINECVCAGVPSSSASPKANSQFMHLLLNPNSGRLPGKDALSSSAEQQQQQRHRVSMTSPLKKNRNALTKP